jgi:hypothetical protein
MRGAPKRKFARAISRITGGSRGQSWAGRLGNDHLIDASKSQLCREGASAGTVSG